MQTSSSQKNLEVQQNASSPSGASAPEKSASNSKKANTTDAAISSPTKETSSPTQGKQDQQQQNSQLPAVTGIFFPNTFFLSWSDFFTLPPNKSAPFPLPRGSYVGVFERFEMIVCILFALMWTFLYVADLYHLGRNLHEILPNDPNPQGHLNLAPPKWNFMKTVFGFTHYDVADHQWRAFDSNLPLLIPGLIVYVGLSQLIRRLFCSESNSANTATSSQSSPKITTDCVSEESNSNAIKSKEEKFTYEALDPSGKCKELQPFSCNNNNNRNFARYLALATMNLIFVVLVHAWGCFFVVPILAAHYFFTVLAGPLLPRWLFLAIMWLVLTALLVSLEWNDGYSKWFSETFPYLVELFPGSPVIRWNAVFNMQMLRLISFSVDFLEAKDKGEAKAKEIALKHKTNCPTCGQIAAKNNAQGRVVASEIQPLCYKARTDTPRPLQEYSFLNFIAYILYLPLYIAGPVSSFNAFASHIQIPQKALSTKDIIRYALRTIGLYLTLVFLLHLCWYPAMRQHDFITEKFTPFTQSGLMFMMLAFLWLKFSIIWKGFRFFGLMDGVEAPEDMVRCFANACRVADFWRDWHASFNLWIVRYMYIPLGGNRYKILVVFPIFFFIAIWHDSKLELLSWALIMCINFVLELVLASQCSRLPFWKTTGYNYRYYVTIGCLYSCVSLVAANAFGFGTGMQSAEFLSKYVTKEYAYLAGYWLCFLTVNSAMALTSREMESNRMKQSSDELKAALGGDVATNNNNKQTNEE